VFPRQSIVFSSCRVEKHASAAVSLGRPPYWNSQSKQTVMHVWILWL